MKPKQEMTSTHPQGESGLMPQEWEGGAVPVDTYGGRVHVEWDPQAAVTGMGQLASFAQPVCGDSPMVWPVRRGRSLSAGIAGVKEDRRRIGCEQLELGFVETLEPARKYEYAVLVA